MDYKMSDNIRYSNTSLKDNSSKKRILIVEDNKVDQQILCAYLKNTVFAEYEILLAHSAKEAISAYRESRPNVILLDLFLTDTFGINTVAELKNAIINTPTIVLSCLNEKEHALKALHYGVQDYILKGEYNEDTLGRALEYSIERHRLVMENKEAEVEFQKDIEKERQRIAMDIHDSIGQSLIAIKYRLAGIETKTDDKLKKDVEDIELLLQTTINETRRLSENITPYMLHHQTLDEAVQELLLQYSNSGEISFHLNCENNLPELDFNTRVNAYRIIQECINNIVKHSEATDSNIDFSYRNGFVSIKIQDNGIGINNYDSSIGNGMKNIKKRCEFIDASLQIINNPGQGTTIILEMPCVEINVLK